MNSDRCRNILLSAVLLLSFAGSVLADSIENTTPLLQEIHTVRDSLEKALQLTHGEEKGVLALQLGVWTQEPRFDEVLPWNDRTEALFELAMSDRGWFDVEKEQYPHTSLGDKHVSGPHWTKALRDIHFLFLREDFSRIKTSYVYHWPGLLDEIRFLADGQLAARTHNLDEALSSYRSAFDAAASAPFVRAEAVLGAASILYRQNRYQTALDTLRWNLRHSGFTDDALLLMGQTLIRLGRVSEASDVISVALEINPYHEQSHYFLGNGYARLNYTQLRNEHPECFVDSSGNSSVDWAETLLHHGFEEEAIDTLAGLVKQHPEWVRPRVMIAEIHWLNGRFDAAEKITMEALDHCPDYGRAHAMMARIQEGRRLHSSPRRLEIRNKSIKRPTPAVPGIENYVLNWNDLNQRHRQQVATAIAPWKHFVPVLVASGATHYIKPLTERLSEAPMMESLRDQRINLDSRLWDDVRGAGGFNTVTGIEDVERLVYGGYNTVVHELTHQVHGLFTDAELRRVEETYQHAKAREASGTPTFMSRYQASTVWEYLAEGVNSYVSPMFDSYDEREIVHERLSKLDPDLLALVEDLLAIKEMTPYYTIGTVNHAYQELERGLVDSSWTALQRIDEDQRNLSPVLSALGRVALLRNDPSTALYFAEKSIKFFPDEPAGYLLKVNALELQGGDILKSTDEILNSAFSRQTLHQRHLLFLAKATQLYRQSRFGAAVAMYDSALAIQSDLPEALWGRGVALADSGLSVNNISTYASGCRDLSKVVKTRSGIVQLRLDYTRTLIEGNQLDEADKQLLEAESLAPNSPEPLVYRAWITALKGDMIKARMMLRTAYSAEASPDEAKILGVYFGLQRAGNFDDLIATFKDSHPFYVYNPRSFRYELRTLWQPWYDRLLSEKADSSTSDTAD